MVVTEKHPLKRENTNLSDPELARVWSTFRANYTELGYRRASYEFFALYLQREGYGEVPTGEEIQRRLHAHRKRSRPS